MGIGTIISLILSALGIVKGLFKRDRHKEAYEEADTAKARQGELEEEIAELDARRKHEENLKKSDEDFWSGN